MKKIVFTIALGLGLLTANAQIEKLAGPRLGAVYISASPASGFLNGTHEIFEDDEVRWADYDPNGTVTSLYGWQFESRFADGYQVTGIVEWIILVGGMERGKFLPSASSMVGARMANGLEFAIGPNLSFGGIAMVFGMGYNFKVGELNMPVNIAFVPGRKETYSREEESHEEYIVDIEYDWGPDGIYNTADDIQEEGHYETIIDQQGYEIPYNTGSRVSITLGFNLGR